MPTWRMSAAPMASPINMAIAAISRRMGSGCLPTASGKSAFSPERKTGFVLLTNGDNGYRMIFDDLLKQLVGDFIFA